MSDKNRKSLFLNIHKKENISLLSTEAASPNYRGFLNLGAIIIIVANFRLIIENVLKYGLLLNPIELGRNAMSIECILTYFMNAIPITIAYYIETKYANNIHPSYSR